MRFPLLKKVLMKQNKTFSHQSNEILWRNEFLGCVRLSSNVALFRPDRDRPAFDGSVADGFAPPNRLVSGKPTDCDKQRPGSWKAEEEADGEALIDAKALRTRSYNNISNLNGLKLSHDLKQPIRMLKFQRSVTLHWTYFHRIRPWSIIQWRY